MPASSHFIISYVLTSLNAQLHGYIVASLTNSCARCELTDMLGVLTLSSEKLLAAGHSQIVFLPTEVRDTFPKWWPRPKSLLYKMRCKTMSQVNTLKNRLQRFLEQAFFIPACAICSAMHQVRLTEAKNSIFPSKCPKNWFLEKNVGEGISTYPSFF